WFQPGIDFAIGGRIPALVQGSLPEWMSPTWITRLTSGSALIESIRRGAFSSRKRLPAASAYGQSPKTATVTWLLRVVLLAAAVATVLPKLDTESNGDAANSFFICATLAKFRPRLLRRNSRA